MQIEKKYEESTLLSLLEQDSEYALQLVFDRYRNTIFKVAMIYVKSPVIAEEIVQDVFLKLWFQRKNLQEIKSLESWLFILTKNLTLNYLKKIGHEWTAREKWLRDNAAAADSSDHKVLHAEYQELLSKVVEKLPSQQQQVFRLAKEKGLSYDAIGDKMSISRGTVKTHMARALAAVRSFFKKY